MRVKRHRNTMKRPRWRLRKGATNWKTFILNRGRKLLWTMKNTFVLMAISCSIVLAITRTTKQNVQTMFTLTRKFPKKILMWIAISNRGMSNPYFCLSKSVAVNTDIYINECLRQKLPTINTQASSWLILSILVRFSRST